MQSIFQNDYNLAKLKRLHLPFFGFYTTPRYVERLSSGQYEKFTADLFTAYCHIGDTVIDVGAHYGYYTLLAAKKIGPSGKVFSFEPEIHNFDILTKNVRRNKLKNVTLSKLAVDQRTGLRKFKIASASDSSGFYQHPISPTKTEASVKTTSLDDYFGNKRVDVIKLDAEGAELEIILGMKNVIKHNPNITLFVEFNPNCIINAHFKPEDLLKLIKKLGFEIFFIDDVLQHWQRLTNIENWQTYLADRNYINMMCRPRAHALSVTFVSHSGGLAGAERALVDLIEGMLRRKVLCQVIVPYGGKLTKTLQDKPVDLVVSPYQWWQKSSGKDDIILSSSLTQILGQSSPHIVLTNSLASPWGAVAAAMVGIPHAWYICEYGNLDYNIPFPLPISQIFKLVDHFSNVIFTTSKAISEYVSSKVATNKITQIYYYITVPNEIDKAKYKFFFKKKALKLVILGTITPTKGQLDAVQTVKSLIAKHIDVELVIAGPVADQKYLQQIKGAIRKNKLASCVHLSPYLENPFPLLKKADILLSCSYQEAFGRTLLEAMALGKPVIGPDIGGVKEIIKDKINGLLFNAGNINDLTRKIEYLAKNRVISKKYGKNGHKMFCSKFTEDNFSGKIYRRLLRLKHASNPLSEFRPFMEAVDDLSISYNKLLHEREVVAVENEKLKSHLNLIYCSRSWRLNTVAGKIINFFSQKIAH